MSFYKVTLTLSVTCEISDDKQEEFGRLIIDSIRSVLNGPQVKVMMADVEEVGVETVLQEYVKGQLDPEIEVHTL